MQLFRIQSLSRQLFAGLLACLLLGLVNSPVLLFAQEAVEQKPVESESATAQELLGISTDKPTDGQFVDLGDGRFMVPYTATLPGTSIEFSMVPIPGGEFQMGSTDEERPDESPTFKVIVEPFWMSKYEVTWAEYQRYMQMDKAFKAMQEDGVRVVSAETEIDAVTAPSALYEPEFTYEAGQEPDQPAATITQFAAKQYTKWLSLSSGQFYRLPFESEWEYACRAGTTTKYYFGDEDDDMMDHAWYEDNADMERHPVGELEPNPWGLYDMYGNVNEWTLDQYDENGYTQIKDKDLSNPLTVEESFHQPTILYPRVLRGGSWELPLEDCSSTSRFPSHTKDWRSTDPNYPKSPWWFTDSPGTGAGFRIMRPLNDIDRAAKSTFWDADLERITKEARNRIEDNGRGAVAPVDTNLHTDIEKIGMSLDDE
jgi:formylglycine-generating enzyme required for sulfatase activity